ncbi:hypothetical protein [Sandaracinus amylolyticus]|uniref:Lipoprotein n=1 Tax=Sandaracinus amylolyticus TaxID=927083 RepID=A0A0F6YND7_9BACT|nr:hypothetical protein [Sandaracinus amylolyticus]AKF11307.1 hypothetical protein DB32_008456 [Sandaracinus amylolyticus]
MTDRENARRKALQAARAVTLGLAIAATTAGCEQVVDRACAFSFTENTRYCCERQPLSYYDPATRTCMRAMIGPFVPPDMPA